MTREMHPLRWGDPAAAAPLPDGARALVEAGVRAADRPPGVRRHRARPVVRPAGAGARSPRRRRRGRARASPTTRSAGSAPAASPRPTCCASAPGTSSTRRTRSSARRTTTRWPAVLAVRGARTTSRWCRSAAAPRVGGLAPGASASRAWSPRPGAPGPPARGRPGLDDRDPRARPARSRGRGAAGGARAHPRALPAVLRVRHHRRLRRHPVQRPGLGAGTAASTTWSSASPSPPRRHARARRAPRRARPGRTCASWCSAPRAPSA